MSLTPPQAYRKVEFLHRSGVEANRPAASDVLVGTLYFSTDTGFLQRSNGQSWELYASTGGSGGPLVPHATTHEAGNTDPVNVTALAGYPGFPQQFLNGMGAFTVPPTNLHASRHSAGQPDMIDVKNLGGYPNNATHLFLRDDGTFTAPTGGTAAAHHATHEVGGADVVTVTEATLSLSNVATNDATNLRHGFLPVTVNDPTKFPRGGALVQWDNIRDTDINIANNAVLNVNSAFHGFAPKTPGDAKTFLRGGSTGEWAQVKSSDLDVSAGGVTPAAHHTTHETGGTDVLANNAWTNIANTFTQDQTVTKPNPGVLWNDPSQPVDQRLFRINNASQRLYLLATNDAITANSGVISMDRAGNFAVGSDLFEKGRSVPMGHWTTVPFNAGNFTGSGAMTWTVAAGNITAFAYTLIGRTMIVSIMLVSTTVGGTADIALQISLPMAAGVASAAPFIYYEGTTYGTAVGQVSAGATVISIYKSFAVPAWALGTLHLYGQLVVSI